MIAPMRCCWLPLLCAVGWWSGCVARPQQQVLCHRDDTLADLEPELTVVRDWRELADTGSTTTLCERITDVPAWRRLQADLGQANERLPEDWCDFGRDCVLFVAFGNGSDKASVRPSVSTEEGIDVITLTCRLAAPTNERPRTGVLLLVPRRNRSTAVVLRRFRNHAPIDETTLRVFDPLQ